MNLIDLFVEQNQIILQNLASFFVHSNYFEDHNCIDTFLQNTEKPLSRLAAVSGLFEASFGGL